MLCRPEFLSNPCGGEKSGFPISKLRKKHPRLDLLLDHRLQERPARAAQLPDANPGEIRPRLPAPRNRPRLARRRHRLGDVCNQADPAPGSRGRTGGAPRSPIDGSDAMADWINVPRPQEEPARRRRAYRARHVSIGHACSRVCDRHRTFSSQSERPRMASAGGASPGPDVALAADPNFATNVERSAPRRDRWKVAAVFAALTRSSKSSPPRLRPGSRRPASARHPHLRHHHRPSRPIGAGGATQFIAALRARGRRQRKSRYRPATAVPNSQGGLSWTSGPSGS